MTAALGGRADAPRTRLFTREFASLSAAVLVYLLMRRPVAPGVPAIAG